MLRLTITLIPVFVVVGRAVEVFPQVGGGYGSEFVGGGIGHGGGLGYGGGGIGPGGGLGYGGGVIGHGGGLGYGGGGIAHGGGLGYGGGGIGQGGGYAIKEVGINEGIGYVGGGGGLGYGKPIGIGGEGGIGYGKPIGIGGGGLGYGGGGIGYAKAIGTGIGGGHIGGPIGYGGEVGGIGYGGGVGPIGYGHQAGIGYGGGVPIGLKGAGIGIGGGGLGIGGGGIGLGGKFIGGEAINQGAYSGGQKNLEGEHFVKSHGNQGSQLNQGGGGFSKGETAVKDVKGESHHFSDADGGKKVYHDGKEYNGGQHFDKEGKQGAEKTLKQGHKKGHNIKGFKSSHHKDETGKTEEFYDEVHDEGGNYGFDGHVGSFGEGGSSSFKGGHQDGKFNAGEAKKAGHFDNEYIVDKAHVNHGKFGGNKFAGNEEVYGLNKGVGESDLSGHHESSKFFKSFPIHY